MYHPHPLSNWCHLHGILRKCPSVQFKMSKAIVVGWSVFSNLIRKANQMYESWLQESQYMKVMISFETLRFSICHSCDILSRFKGSSSNKRTCGNNIRVRKWPDRKHALRIDYMLWSACSETLKSNDIWSCLQAFILPSRSLKHATDGAH